MGQHGYRALVVDDEMLVRDLTTRALSLEGIDCNSTADGAEALQLLKRQSYDAVVTDLRMPNTHGHALAVQVLARENPPVVIVLTGVSEPRLAKDLLKRGVSDIVFKPTDYGVLALKVKKLLEERRVLESAGSTATPVEDTPDANTGLSTSDEIVDAPEADEADDEGTWLTKEEVAEQIQHAPAVMPVSEAALNVYTMAQSTEFDARAIASAIQKHESMSNEVVRLANTLFYNPDKQPVNTLERGVVRVGTRRIGQLALAANALAAVRDQQAVRSLDVGRIWRQCITAGMVMELLVKQGGHEAIDDGLLLCATMAPLGHVILGQLFPTEYEKMMRECLDKSVPLLDAEERVFGKARIDAVSLVLKDWGVPEKLYAPLKYVTHNYHEVEELDEPLRSQVELVKLAEILSQISVRGWHGWDLLELPPANTLAHLRISSPTDILNEACACQDGINQFGAELTQEASPMQDLVSSGRSGSD